LAQIVVGVLKGRVDVEGGVVQRFGGKVGKVPGGLEPAGSRALTKTDHAYYWIRERILAGELEPGQTLDQERLAEIIGVSPTPLREAMRRLESEQLVVNRAHHVAIVAPVSLDILNEVYEVRFELEPRAAQLAAQHGSDEQLAEIAALIAEPPTEQDPMTLLYYNGGIHRMIYRASGNSVLIRILDQMSDLVDRYRAITFREDPQVIYGHSDHVDIADALLARDGRRVAKLMRDHLEFGHKRMNRARQAAEATE
jgi:DNA-binding GntR family transcriptional regulator